MERPQQTAYQAKWVLPIHAPAIADGTVVVSEGQIEAVGPTSELLDKFPFAEWVDLEETIVLPGLVNAHTHLALTDAVEDLPQGKGLLEWLKVLVPQAREFDQETARTAILRGLEQSRGMGTSLVGDILAHGEAIETYFEQENVWCRVFMEFLGVREDSAHRALEKAKENVSLLAAKNSPRVLGGLSPHAPYSVWPELWEPMAAWAQERNLPWTTHLAEPPSEAEFLLEGTGPILDYLKWLGAWDETFPPLGDSGVDYLHDRDVLDDLTLLVHGVHLTPEEIEKVVINDSWLCLCPRSNQFLGLPPSPAEDLYHAGANLCLGTDSKASNWDLGIWGELRSLRGIAPTIPPSALIRMATANGAMALGFLGKLGTIHPGAEAQLLSVPCSELGDGDPHHFLVSESIEDRFQWLGKRP